MFIVIFYGSIFGIVLLLAIRDLFVTPEYKEKRDKNERERIKSTCENIISKKQSEIKKLKKIIKKIENGDELDWKTYWISANNF